MSGDAATAASTHDEIVDLVSLHAAVNVAAGYRNALDGQIVDIAVWMLANDDWKGEGLGKPAQYLSFRFGLTSRTAQRYVEVAERADELPESVDALRRGELSLDQLMPIVRRVPGWADDQVLRLAKKLTVAQISATINKYNFARSGPLNPDPAEPELEPEPSTETDTKVEDEPAPPKPPVEPADRCWFGVGDDGRWRLNLETTAEIGKTIENAIRERRDAEFRISGNMISDAEALADACQRSLDAIDDPARKDRFRLNLHMRTDGVVTDEHGIALPDAVSAHVICDGLLSPVFFKNGVPISVGDTQRIVPNRTRRQVLFRDGGCRVPGCGAKHHLDIHHIIHWADGGGTDTWNLVALCGHHHRAHHHGKLGIEGNADEPDGLRITNQHGVNMFDAGARPEPPEGPPPAPAGEYTKPLRERIDMNYVSFSHPERRKHYADTVYRNAMLRLQRDGHRIDQHTATRLNILDTQPTRD